MTGVRWLFKTAIGQGLSHASVQFLTLPVGGVTVRISVFHREALSSLQSLAVLCLGHVPFSRRGQQTPFAVVDQWDQLWGALLPPAVFTAVVQVSREVGRGEGRLTRGWRGGNCSVLYL